MYRRSWVKTNGATYYVKKNGRMATGIVSIKPEKTYYFGSNGKRRSGWVTLGGVRYYFGTDAQGYMYRDKLATVDGKVYYLQEDGSMATGLRTVSGYQYYFTKNGAYTGTHQINGISCTFDSKGRLIASGPNLSISSD